MPTRARPLPDQLRETTFTRGDLHRAGLSPRRIEAKDVTAVGRGLYRLDAPGEPPQRLSDADPSSGLPRWTVAGVAALQRDHPHLVVSRLSAARLHGMPLPPWADVPKGGKEEPLGSPVTVTSLQDHSVRRPGVRTHRTDLLPAHIVTRRGLQATSPIRTLWDLCAPRSGVTHDDLVVLADSLMPQEWIPGFGLAEIRTSRADLDRVRREMGLFHGARRAALVSADMREAVGSPMETRTRLQLVAAGLPEPEVAVALRDDAGHAGPVVDLAYRRWRLVIQYEGERHRTKEQQERDVDRDRWCSIHRWETVKVIARDVEDGLAAVVPLIRARAAQFGG